jgi:hypothetical protein
MVWVVFVLIGTTHSQLTAQELYVFSDPASNVPSKSLSVKYGSKWINGDMFGTRMIMSRHMGEASVGLSKKWMIRPAFTMSDMFTNRVVKWESVSLYTKFRFYSRDEVHRHFRAAAFVKALYSTNSLEYDDLNTEGDQSVVQGGVILTQLINKLAISSTLALTEVTNGERWKKYLGPRNFGYRSFNYAVSAGYLFFPKQYTSYNQTNFNVYLELIGSRGIDRKYYFVDLAPAVQFILNSNTKINLGYRFQAKGNAYRMSNAAPSISFSVERTFFNTFRK